MSNEVAKKQEPQITVLNRFMESRLTELKNALPKHMDANRFKRIALTELAKNKDLAKCTPESFWLSLLHCAQIGLEPGAALGQAYLIPYENKDGTFTATVQLGYRGLVNLVRRSGEISTFYAQAVHEGDFFNYELGSNPTLRHRPEAKSNVTTHVYAFVRFKDGAEQFEVMTADQVDYIREKFSKAKNSPAWKDSYDEMAKKTVIRRIIKMLPMSVEMSDYLRQEGEVYDAEATEVKPDPEKYSRLLDAPEIVPDKEGPIHAKKLSDLCAEAKTREIDVADLVGHDVEKFIASTDVKKLIATCTVIQNRITKAPSNYA